MRKILVPIAYFESCQTALELGGKLAQHLGAGLTVLHVVSSSNRSLLGGRVASGKLAEWGIEPPSFKLLRQAELRLKDLGVLQLDVDEQPVEVHSLKHLTQGLYEVHLLGSGGQDVRFRLREGDPVREILREAEDPRYDLVITGTRGQRGLWRVWVGSVAQTVAQYAPCSTLVAKNLRPDQKVLVGVSGRETALEAVRQAAVLAYVRRTPLVLLAVAPSERGRPEAERHLDDALEVLRSSEVPASQIERRVRIGEDPARVLIAEAGEDHIIALGRVKLSKVKELFLGDVSLRILEDSQGPVLIASTPRPLSAPEPSEAECSPSSPPPPSSSSP